MKKLMIAAVAIAIVGVVNAATYSWSTAPVVPYGGSEQTAGGTYYLMKGDAVAAKSFIETVLGAKAEYATTFATLVAAAENYATYSTESYTLVDQKQGEWNSDFYTLDWGTSDTVGSKQSFYQVILDTSKNGIYVSEITDVEVIDVGGTMVALYNEGTTTFGTDVTTYQGSGWYTAESVPEPTSGLLLLLGVAGLALRRRRA